MDTARGLGPLQHPVRLSPPRLRPRADRDPPRSGDRAAAGPGSGRARGGEVLTERVRGLAPSPDLLEDVLRLGGPDGSRPRLHPSGPPSSTSSAGSQGAHQITLTVGRGLAGAGRHAGPIVLRLVRSRARRTPAAW